MTKSFYCPTVVEFWRVSLSGNVALCTQLRNERNLLTPIQMCVKIIILLAESICFHGLFDLVLSYDAIVHRIHMILHATFDDFFCFCLHWLKHLLLK